MTFLFTRQADTNRHFNRILHFLAEDYTRIEYFKNKESRELLKKTSREVQTRFNAKK